MAQVDPYDDTLLRLVVHHYAFDPDRHERRNILVAAYDDEGEFRREMDRLGGVVRARRAAPGGDAEERVSGAVWPPGYHAQVAAERSIKRAVEHGVGSVVTTPAADVAVLHPDAEV